MYLFKKCGKSHPFPYEATARKVFANMKKVPLVLRLIVLHPLVLKLRQVIFFDSYFCCGSVRPRGLDVGVVGGGLCFLIYS